MGISDYLSFATLVEKNLPFYIATIGNPKYQPPVYRPVGIEDYQFLYTVQGTGTCIIKGKKYDLKPKDALFLPPGTTHEYYPSNIGNTSTNNLWETEYITFNGTGMRDFYDFKPCIITFDNELNFEEEYKILYRLKNSPDMIKKTSINLYSLLLSVKDYAVSEPSMSGKGMDIMTKAIHYVTEISASTNHFTLKDIADKLNVSEEHFCRVFKEYTGFRPFEYINMLRIQKAKDLLVNTNLPISKIAESIGFDGHSYFSMIFKKYVSCTPGEYRKMRVVSN